MTARRLVLLVGLGLLAVVGLRIHYSEERVIARRLNAMAAAFDEERILALAGFVSRRYRDEENLSYETLLGLFKGVFDRYDELELVLDVGRVELTGETATVRVSFRILGRDGGEHGSIVGSLTDPARATLKLIKERGDWKLASSSELYPPGIPEFAG